MLSHLHDSAIYLMLIIKGNFWLEWNGPFYVLFSVTGAFDGADAVVIAVPGALDYAQNHGIYKISAEVTSFLSLFPYLFIVHILTL